MPRFVDSEKKGPPAASPDAALRIELGMAATDAIMASAFWLTDPEVYSSFDARTGDVPADIAGIWLGQGKVFAIERGEAHLCPAYSAKLCQRRFESDRVECGRKLGLLWR